MAKVTLLEYPFAEETVRGLKVGQKVCVTGRLCVGRDRFHRYLAQGGESPLGLRDGAIFHCGPVIMRDGKHLCVQAAGPTTSMREEPYMAGIIRDHGVRIIIGKGGMGEETRQACKLYGCVYLQAVGGAASVLAQCVEDVTGVYFEKEFGPAEALYEFRVKNFEAIVTMDAHGRSLHKRVLTASRRALRNLIGV